ncbi:MAG TPA: type I methionyl aminopeptidase [Bacteroidales bacterium]|nr:type I methionyl aminopeptidase [Bacteroidales bacterium]HPS73244.1 type I methionyl aminopeptidase [Bacteroidales bacterium]
MQIKTAEDIEKLRENAIIVSKTLAEVAKYIKPGVTTLALDRIAEDFIRSQGAVPGFKGYNGFPGTLCISVNEEVVHGIPGDRVLKNGDIASVDCGCQKDGFNGDSAYTFAVGEVRPEVLLLMQRTKESLYLGIESAVAGKRLGDIGAAIQEYVESFGYGVVRELVGHGIGMHLHEKPDVPNYGRRGSGMKLLEGMTICIEPMINLGTKNVLQSSDGWTIRTADRLPSAHYELTVAVAKGKADVLSTFRYIEEVLGTKTDIQ